MKNANDTFPMASSASANSLRFLWTTARTLNGMIVSDSTFGSGGGGGGTSVPEQDALQLLGVGLAGLGVMRRRLLPL